MVLQFFQAHVAVRQAIECRAGQRGRQEGRTLGGAGNSSAWRRSMSMPACACALWTGTGRPPLSPMSTIDVVQAPIAAHACYCRPNGLGQTHAAAGVTPLQASQCSQLGLLSHRDAGSPPCRASLVCIKPEVNRSSTQEQRAGRPSMGRAAGAAVAARWRRPMPCCWLGPGASSSLVSSLFRHLQLAGLCAASVRGTS